MINKILQNYMWVCLFLGSILLVDFFPESEIATNIQSSIATTFLSVGIIGLIADRLMRYQLQQELIRLVGIQGSIMSHKIDGVGTQEDLDWEGFLKSGTNFKFVLADAEIWIRENWSKIEKRAEEVPIQIEIYIPDPDSSYIEHLSKRNGHIDNQLVRGCEDFVQTLESLWRGTAAKIKTKTNSKLSIFVLENIPSYSLISSEIYTHLLISPPVARNLARQPFRLSFGSSFDVEPVAEFHYRVRPNEGNRLTFENVVKK